MRERMRKKGGSTHESEVVALPATWIAPIVAFAVEGLEGGQLLGQRLAQVLGHLAEDDTRPPAAVNPFQFVDERLEHDGRRRPDLALAQVLGLANTAKVIVARGKLPDTVGEKKRKPTGMYRSD